MAAHFATLGKSLDNSVGAYNRAIASLETRVLVAARKFKDLGAAAGDDIEGATPVETSIRELAESTELADTVENVEGRSES